MIDDLVSERTSDSFSARKAGLKPISRILIKK